MRDVAPTTPGERLAVADPERIEPLAGFARPSALRPEAAYRQENRATLRVAIDARKLTDAESGIGNYTFNLVKGLLAEDKDLNLLLLHSRIPGSEKFSFPLRRTPL
jgi:hypothetical protein